MTPERDRLLAEKALRRADELAPGTRSIPDAIAEREAELAKLDAEPDWEAWRPALAAYKEEYWRVDDARGPDIDIMRGLIAAAPLMPRDAGMSEEEIEALARDAVATVSKQRGHEPPIAEGLSHQAAAAAIRETLKRAPQVRWPGEAEIEQHVLTACDEAYREVYGPVVPDVNTPYVKAFARHFARLTGEGK